MPNLANIFANIPSLIDDENIEVLVKTNQLTIERIISRGHSSPASGWYQQAQNEFVLLVQGTAQLEFEDGAIALVSGDHLVIAAGQRHRVTATSTSPAAIWLTVYYD